MLYQRLVQDEKLREVLVSSFFRADNHAVIKEILVNKSPMMAVKLFTKRVYRNALTNKIYTAVKRNLEEILEVKTFLKVSIGFTC